MHTPKDLEESPHQIQPTETERRNLPCLSILAGDAFGKSPTRLPIFLFKIAYYLVYLFNFRENWAAFQRRTRGVPDTVTTLKDYAIHDRR
ncbi:MAG: hypothetical protein HP493_03360 [Nitrospira sp.]|nr:hypothetical protein [Nitrospira sp.]